MKDDDTRYGLVCPFLTDDSQFAAGVEFGMLFTQMRESERNGEPISGYFTVVNQEQITLAANRLGWRIVKMQPWKDAPGQWFWLEMEPPERLTGWRVAA